MESSYRKLKIFTSALYTWILSKKGKTYAYDTKNDNANIWNNEFGSQIIFVYGTNHSCGMMVLIKNGLDIKITNTFVSTDNRSLIAECFIKDIKYFIVCLYAPSSENSQIAVFV